MNVSKVRTKLIPATIIAGTMAVSNVIAQKQAIDTDTENKIEYTADKSKKTDTDTDTNTIKWSNLIFGFSMGAIGGSVITKAIGKFKSASDTKKATVDKNNYFDTQFKADSNQLQFYLHDLLKNAEKNDSYTLDMFDFDKNTQFFTTAYPSRAGYVNMFAQAFVDQRLHSEEKQVLCTYLKQKAGMCSTDKEEHYIILNLYKFLDGIEDYETLVKEFQKHPTETVDQSNSGAISQAVGGAAEAIKISDFGKEIKHNLSFKDVGGQEEAIKALKENVLFPIQYPSGFVNDSVDNCILLYGPPGTGKTLVAEALINEAKVPYVKMNANDLTSKWVGETEENWRSLFDDAIKNQPCIIFIDEFDSIAGQRGRGDEYNDKTVGQILSLLSDIVSNNDKVYLIATTNRIDIIDDAMLRSLRFGLHVELKPPQNVEDTKRIFEIHLKKKPYEGIDTDIFAKKLFEKNATGADIATVVGRAYRAAKDRNHIFEKMENGTYKDSDMDNVKIIPKDLDKEISKLKSKEKTRTPIGFKKTACEK